MKRTLIATAGASAIAVAMIAGFEGYRQRAYDDGVGVQTVGFGSTRREDGSPVQRGDTITPGRAVILLARDADRIAQELAACLGPVPLYKYEWDAYVSWAYNVGSAAACRSTLVKKLHETPPDYAGACRELLKWTRAGGRVLPGLVKRREAEYKMCMGEKT
ncbi:lysozyme [Sulfuritortus calidifontis]|uniref:Lysozyme n=1 Tax=Sulfuritortus calidifontis TaxID=1914471 RepID=A0A4R3JTJ9_9PROT|nr:lysozyme [Sulfuritortus calidifontis]TCS70757.1 lysozyme [Sulfuritortus calidifontis]